MRYIDLEGLWMLSVAPSWIHTLKGRLREGLTDGLFRVLTDGKTVKVRCDLTNAEPNVHYFRTLATRRPRSSNMLSRPHLSSLPLPHASPLLVSLPSSLLPIKLVVRPFRSIILF